MAAPDVLNARATPRRASTDAAFSAAVALHLAGDLAGAERAYRRLLLDAPRHASAHNNLGSLLAARNELGAALACYATAAELDPSYGEAFHNFGLVLASTEQLTEAVPLLERAVALEPRRATWWSDLGNALIGLGRAADALVALDRARALDPANVAARLARARPLRDLGRATDAIASCEDVLAIEPRSVAAWANLAQLRREQRDLDGALAAAERAVSLDASTPFAVVQVAYTLLALGRIDEARRAAEWLTGAHANVPDAWNVLGAVAFEQAEYDVAEACFNRSLTQRPDDATANWNLALLVLLRGDLREGFARFEHRKRVWQPGLRVHPGLPPEWDGRPLAGERVVVLAEQGLGDQLHFARYLPALKAYGAGHVTVECADTVRPLLEGMLGVDALVSRDATLPEADVHVRLMGLPLRTGTTLDAVPRAEGYLRAPVRAVAERVRTVAGPRIGIAWAGNPLHSRDAQRSISFAQLAPLLAVPGVQFISLQQGEAAQALAAQPQVMNLGPELADVGDAAAVVAELDLLITVDSMLAHLAGALGVPVWTALSHVPDWRWRLARDDTPWYARMRLVRQPARGAWAPVVEALVEGVLAIAAGTLVADLRPVVSAHAAATHAAPPVALPSYEYAARRPVSVHWPVGLTSGWGTYGLQLVRHLAGSARAEAVLACEPDVTALDATDALTLATVPRSVSADRAAHAVHLSALGNSVAGSAPVFTARRNVGVVFLEDTAIDGAARRRAAGFDQLVAGSRWNAALLRAIGHPRVDCVWQGIDPALFRPRPRDARFGDRFVVLSGGKLEFRKGQDLVVAAFRAFRARHPEALLVTAWHNHWPATMVGIDAMGHVQGMPALVDGRLDVTGWLAANGIPATAVHDLGLRSQAEIAPVLAACDVALFPNRAEGGTNLVAMEAMASGVCAIVAANTGQRDLLTEGGAIALTRQSAVTPVAPYRGTEGWGESDVEEMVEALEQAWQDRAAMRARGAAGAAHVGAWTWARQVESLLDAVLDPAS